MQLLLFFLKNRNKQRDVYILSLQDKFWLFFFSWFPTFTKHQLQAVILITVFKEKKKAQFFFQLFFFIKESAFTAVLKLC